jgi:dTDP-4-amino-4,6-dideoxygalactose transaminase
MDVLQASILMERLKKLDEVISVRQKNAGIYDSLFDKDFVSRPQPRENCVDTFHTYVIQVDNRDRLRNYLKKAGIETAIHYPIPIHLQPAAKFLGYKRGDFPVCERQSERILSLPIHQNLQTNEIERVAKAINTFLQDGSRD